MSAGESATASDHSWRWAKLRATRDPARTTCEPMSSSTKAGLTPAVRTIERGLPSNRFAIVPRLKAEWVTVARWSGPQTRCRSASAPLSGPFSQPETPAAEPAPGAVPSLERLRREPAAKLPLKHAEEAPSTSVLTALSEPAVRRRPYSPPTTVTLAATATTESSSTSSPAWRAVPEPRS